MAAILITLACAVPPDSPGAVATSTGKQAPPAAAAREPAAQWSMVSDPGELGWSKVKLRQAAAMLEDLGTAAFLVVTDGRIVFSHGPLSTRFKMHSIRKSLLSALLGISIHEGKIDPGASLRDLGIDDLSPKLTAEEKQATVLDLLKSRSGIFHPAVHELPSMIASRPEPGSHRPGEHWYYNNWDFNALGTIFEVRAGEPIGRAFGRRIARPIGMEDFKEEDVEYARGAQSIHAAYPFRLSARDLARFGLLYLRGGRWGGQQVLPEDWVRESTRAHSNTGRSGTMSGYGYMWWVATRPGISSGRRVPNGTVTASGHGGQRLVIIPTIDTVLVHLMDTEGEESEVGTGEFDRFMDRLMGARQD